MPAETFETLDAVPEELRESAIETKAGTFLLIRDPDTSGLTSALEKERTARKAEEKTRKDREKRLAELELEAKAREGGLTSEKLADIRKQVAAEFEPYRVEAEALKSKVRALTLDSVVKAKLGDFVDVEVAWKQFGDEFDLTDDGQPIVKTEPGKTLDKHIADLKARFPYLVRGTQAGGGAAAGNTTGAGTRGTGDNVFQWTPEQRADFIRTNGPDAYQAKLDASVQAQANPKAA